MIDSSTFRILDTVRKTNLKSNFENILSLDICCSISKSVSDQTSDISEDL